jgi:hypothetical protein
MSFFKRPNRLAKIMVLLRAVHLAGCPASRSGQRAETLIDWGSRARCVFVVALSARNVTGRISG